MAECQARCLSSPGCKGVEHNPHFGRGRCEVWTRPKGIGATAALCPPGLDPDYAHREFSTSCEYLEVQRKWACTSSGSARTCAAAGHGFTEAGVCRISYHASESYRSTCLRCMWRGGQ